MMKMQIGAIVDYCIEYDRQQKEAEAETEKPTKRMATQRDIDAFFGGY